MIVFAFSLNVKSQQTDVMLQGFNWVSWQSQAKWYNVVSDKSVDLKNIGINAIWLPPPSLSTGGAGYIPTVWMNMNSSYGTEAQLKSMITNLHNNNIKALADIVVNHRGGTTGWYDFTSPSFNTPNQTWSICSNSCLNDNCSQKGTGNLDYNPVSAGLKSQGESGLFSAGRDLDHSNPGVRQGVKDYLNFLKNTIGFDGWRYDYVHGFDGKYIKEYNQATNPYFSVGELLEGDRNRIIRWLDYTKDGSADANSSAFDFATKRALQDAFNQNNLSFLNDGTGKASGLIGIWPSKAVTVLDNHDTGAFPNQAHWVFPSQHVVKGYAYILTHPGVPMIFWDHLYDWGTAVSNPIRSLVSIRKRNGIHSTSSLNIVTARQDLYAAIIDNKVAMKLGAGDWNPGAGWNLAVSGDQYAVWDKAIVNPIPALTITPAGGTYNSVQTVNLSATPNATIHYTTNGTEPTTSSPSFTNSGTLNIAANTTLRAFATNSAGRSVAQTHVYNISTVTSFTVYFQKPSTWTANTVNVHFWNRMPGSTASTWPGVSMTLGADGWYSYTFANTTSTSLLFNNGGTGSVKSVDLTRNKNGWYKDGLWFDTKPTTPIASGLKVHFNKPTNWANAKMYYWNVLPTGCAPAVAWPGNNMTPETGAWFETTIGNCSSANIIFNSGTGQQSADLTRNTEGWFKNGVWFNSASSAGSRFGTSLEVSSNSGIAVAGNNLFFNYTFTTSSSLKLEVISINGTVVKSQDFGNSIIGSNTYNLDISNLSKGIYLLKVIHSQNNEVYKFMK